MTSRTATSFWVFFALLAASIEPIIVKLGYRGHLTPIDLLVYKHVVAALVIVPLARAWRWIGWSAFKDVLIVSLLLMLTNGLVLSALRYSSATTIVTIITTTPAFVAIVNKWRGKDELNMKFWLGFGLCFLGVLLSIDTFNTSAHTLDFRGVLAAAGAVLSSTTYRTRMEDVTVKVPPRTVSTYIFLIDGVLVLALLPFTSQLGVEDTLACVWIGVAAAIANIAFLAAISLVGSTRMSIFDMLQRPLVIMLAALVLYEPLGWEKILGILCVLGGVYLAKVKRVVSGPTNGSVTIMQTKEA